MNWAALRDLEQPALLVVSQVAAQFDFTIYSVQKALLGFTVLAILGMNAEMFQTNRNALQIDALALRVQPQSHGRTGTQTRHQELIRRRPGIGSEWCRFVGPPPVISCNDFLCQSLFVRNNHSSGFSHGKTPPFPYVPESSAEGPYKPGTFPPMRRIYVVSWPR